MTKRPNDQQPAAKKGPGRPPKGAVAAALVAFRIEPKLLARIDRAAKKAKLTRTAWVELAAVEKLARA